MRVVNETAMKNRDLGVLLGRGGVGCSSVLQRERGFSKFKFQN